MSVEALDAKRVAAREDERGRVDGSDHELVADRALHTHTCKGGVRSVSVRLRARLHLCECVRAHGREGGSEGGRRMCVGVAQIPMQ